MNKNQGMHIIKYKCNEKRKGKYKEYSCMIPAFDFFSYYLKYSKSRKENPQKLTQLSSRSHPRHLVGKRTAQKDITIDTTSDSQVNSNFPNKW